MWCATRPITGSNRPRSKAVTPFLLDLIFDLTEGRSLEANRALVLSNARLATDIARAIARG